MLYLALIGYAIRLLPVGRLAAACLLVSPTCLHLAGSFSADPVGNGLSAILIVSCLRMHTTPVAPYSSWNLAKLLLLSAFIGLLKPTYLPLTGMLFVVPREQFRSRRDRIIFAGLGVGLALSVALLWGMNFPFVPGLYWHTGADPAAALGYAIGHPVANLIDVGRALATNALQLWAEYDERFGGHPAPYNFSASPVLSAIDFLAIGSLALTGYRLYLREATYLLLILALGYAGMTAVAFKIAYAPPFGHEIIGLQGRYFLPAFFFTGLALTSGASRLRSAAYWAQPALLSIILIARSAIVLEASHHYGALWR